MSETIAEFLIGLGFDPRNEAAINKFKTGIDKTKFTVLGLAAAVAATAVAVEIGVRKMADKFEALYYASDRTGAAVKNIQSLGYAMSKLGGQADDALSALDGLASFMRSTPAAEKFLSSLGVGTRDANGNLRDTSDILKDLVPRLKQMPFYLAKAYGGVLGIGESQLITLFRDTGEYQAEYLDMLAKAGVDSEKAAKASRDYRNELRTLGAAFGILWDKVMIRALDPKAGFITKVRAFVMDHYEQISKTVDVGLDKLAKVFDWFGRGLDAAQQGKFFDWLKSEWGGFVEWLREKWRDLSPYVQRAWASVLAWLGDQWKAHGQGVTDTLGRVLAWFKEAFFGVLDDVADYFGERIDQALRDRAAGLPDWLRTRLGLGEYREGWIDEEEKRLRKEERQKRIDAARSAIVGAFGSALNFVIPSASANTETPEMGMDKAGRIAKAYQFFMSKGLSSAQAAGIVGNLLQESGLNPGAVGDGGKARGIAQWHPDRQGGMGGSLDSQLAHVWGELQGPERRALNMLLNARTAAEAAVAFSRGYERPGDPMMGNRIAYANAVLGQMQGGGLQAGGAVTLNQKTDIHVSSADPAAAGAAIGREQDRVNQRLARNMRGAVG